MSERSKTYVELYTLSVIFRYFRQVTVTVKPFLCPRKEIRLETYMQKHFLQSHCGFTAANSRTDFDYYYMLFYKASLLFQSLMVWTCWEGGSTNASIPLLRQCYYKDGDELKHWTIHLLGFMIIKKDEFTYIIRF